jgi:hypothetical protein
MQLPKALSLLLILSILLKSHTTAHLFKLQPTSSRIDFSSHLATRSCLDGDAKQTNKCARHPHSIFFITAPELLLLLLNNYEPLRTEARLNSDIQKLLNLSYEDKQTSYIHLARHSLIHHQIQSTF